MSGKIGRIVALFASMAMMVAFADLALAEETATHKMAQIVMHLHHYPDDSDKQVLEQIEMSASPAEATIASALIHMKHHVRDEDKPKLDEVSKDTTVPNNTRELAAIVMHLMHKASSSDKEKLHQM
jgi:uncharacterized protein (UPF0147 family)